MKCVAWFLDIFPLHYISKTYLVIYDNDSTIFLAEEKYIFNIILIVLRFGGISFIWISKINKRKHTRFLLRTKSNHIKYNFGYARCILYTL